MILVDRVSMILGVSLPIEPCVPEPELAILCQANKLCKRVRFCLHEVCMFASLATVPGALPKFWLFYVHI